MSSKPYRVGQWIPSDQKVIDKWLANLTTEVQTKYKDKLELLMVLHPPAVNGETDCGETRLVVAYGTEEDLGLHPPVQELLKAIISQDQHVLPSDVLATVQEYGKFEKNKDPLLATYDYFNRLHHDNSSRVQQNQFGWSPYQCNPELADGYDCWIFCFPQRKSQQVVQKYSQLLGKVSFQFCFLSRVD